MILSEAVFERLSEVGLEPRRGPVAPFEQKLPLVSGWVTDENTGLLALVAECEEKWDEEPWRNLLFAVSGMRHSLADGRRTATGVPVVLALVESGEDERALLHLVEKLTGEYLLFTRIDLSLVSAVRVFEDGELLDEQLDYALAPLLPVCREAIRKKWRIDSTGLSSFRAELAKRIDSYADELSGEPWGQYVPLIQGEVRERICDAVLVSEQPVIEPRDWSRLRLEDFRAVRELELDLCEATIVEGLNGTGKSSLFEAIEILWSEASSRKPDGVKVETYREHLRRDGKRDFSIQGVNEEGEVRAADGPVDDARPLRRTMLHQDVLGHFVSLTAKKRYEWFLRQAGLETPNIREAHKGLQHEALEELDRTFAALNVEQLGRTDRNASGRLEESLGAVKELAYDWPPPSHELSDRFAKVAAEHNLRYVPEYESDRHALFSVRLEEFAQRCATAAKGLRSNVELASQATSLANDLRERARAMRGHADALRSLFAAIATQQQSPPPSRSASEPLPEIDPSLAARWLHGSDEVKRQAKEFRLSIDRIESERWSPLLLEYVETLEAAAGCVPRDELSEIAVTMPRLDSATESQPIEARLLEAACLAGKVEGWFESSFSDELGALAKQLDQEAVQTSGVADRLDRHPGVLLAGREDELLTQIARFELARKLRKPIEEAEALALADLVKKDGLQEVFGELVASLTRFEWYFKPAKLQAKRKSMEVRGVVVEDDDEKLELRMLLNSGESAIVGLAWFFAQHLLQDPGQRSLLMIDDPFAGLDPNNRAAVAETIRAYARLVRPAFFMLSTHEAGLGEILEEEFGPVAGWPKRVGRIRFKRLPDNSICASKVSTESEQSSFDSELGRLGVSNGQS